jgi:hypothetical protein
MSLQRQSSVLAAINTTLAGGDRAVSTNRDGDSPLAAAALFPRASTPAGIKRPSYLSAFGTDEPRCATPVVKGAFDYVTTEDAAQMRVRFKSSDHQASSAAVLHKPLSRIPLHGIPAYWHVKSTKPQGGSIGRPPTSDGATDTTAARRPVTSNGPLQNQVQSRDVAALCRIAAVQSDHPTAKRQHQLRHRLPMAGIDLRWVYEVARRPTGEGDQPSSSPPQSPTDATSPRSLGGSTREPSCIGASPRKAKTLGLKPLAAGTWVTVAAITSLTEPQAEHTIIVNSPRSVLALLRRGIDTEQLWPIDDAAERRRLDIEGLDRASLEARIAFLHSERQRLCEEAQLEFQRAVNSIDRADVIAFIDAFIDSGCDYARLPLLVYPKRMTKTATAPVALAETVTPACEIRMPTDDRVSDALQAIRDKTAREQHAVKMRVQLELEGRTRLAQMSEARALDATQVARRRQAAAQELSTQRREEAELRALIAEEKAQLRAEMRQAAEAKLDAARRHTDALAAAAEKAAADARDARKRTRDQRLNDKRAKRDERVAEAAVAAARIDAQRQQRIDEADRYRLKLQSQQQEEHAHNLKESREQAEEQARRRDAVLARAERRLERKREATEGRRAAAEEALAQFESNKAVVREVRQLRDLKRALQREDVANAADQRERDELDGRVRAAQEQQSRFDAFRQHVISQREALTEQQRQERSAKRDTVAQNTRRHEFERLAVEHELDAKTASAELLTRSRLQIVREATAARSRVGVERRDRLAEAAAEMVKAERKTFFKILDATENLEQPSPRGTTGSETRAGVPVDAESAALHQQKRKDAEAHHAANSPVPLQTPIVEPVM